MLLLFVYAVVSSGIGIPVVAILDTNCNPENIDFPIPGNDDATRAIGLYCNLVADAVLDGIQQELSAQGVDIGAQAAPEEVIPEVVEEAPAAVEPPAEEAAAAVEAAPAAEAPAEVKAEETEVKSS